MSKHNDLIETYNIIFEMYSRGIEFENVNIHKSRSQNYEIDKEAKKLIPPFSIIEGIGDIAAQSATSARKEKPFESITDFKNRSKFPKKILQKLEEYNIFANEEKDKIVTQQLSLFE